MRLLLTGAAGFAGSHLAEFLIAQRSTDHPAIELHGITHRHDHRIHHLREQMHVHRGDLRNALWISELIQQVQPEHCLHLAAQSDVVTSWRQPWSTYELNIQAQLNLIEALCRWAPTCRTLIVSSNELYGLVRPEDLPIDEETPFRPTNPYGVSKVAQDMMAYQYWLSHKIPTLRARSFNHIGPGQSADFAASAFARQIAEIELKRKEPILQVGNLQSERDITDVRDVVRAYWLLALHGQPGEAYNVGSGSHRPMRWLLDTLLTMTDVPIRVELDPDRLRPSDIPISVCDNRRLVTATGWQPEIDLKQTLRDVLNYWREVVRNES